MVQSTAFSAFGLLLVVSCASAGPIIEAEAPETHVFTTATPIGTVVTHSHTVDPETPHFGTPIVTETPHTSGTHETHGSPSTHPPTAAPTGTPGTGPTTIPPVRPANTTICKGHKEGDFIIDPKDPHIYYECTSKGLAYKFTCPHGLVFNEVKKACDFDPKGPTIRPPDHGSSKFNCTGKKDGFYADEHDKTKFHECHAGYASDFQCPPTTVWVPGKNVCDHSSFLSSQNEVFQGKSGKSGKLATTITSTTIFIWDYTPVTTPKKPN